ncbi:MAG: hypothetical protein MJ147_04485 [Clostridia bacterium]|nr:hypothetical protein [Clostridia bacterium]
MDNIFEKFPMLKDSTEEIYDCRENCFMKLYKGTDVSDFESYVALLENDGFTLLQKREIDGNLFASMKKDVQVNILFTPCNGETRVTASENDQTPNLNKTECDGNCTTTFYGFENDQALIDCGMCLLIQCRDYSFFVVDSGHYFQFNDNDRIHKFMRERTPEGQKIVINGWFITHAHTDHISKLIDFLKYNTDDVVIEGFYQNLLSSSYDIKIDNHEELEMAEKLFKILHEYPAPVYKLHTGMRFYIRNLAFDVLGTHEDIYPEKITDYNDSSAILMVEAEDSKIFIPGDAAVAASVRLEERFTDALKCDVVQVSHHGHTGLSKNLYEKLMADTAVFPVTRIFYDDDMGKREANRRIAEIATHNLVTGDGTVCVPMPYNKETVYTLPDETFEDFGKIERLWKYTYSDERKEELFQLFLKNGGDAEKMLIPTSKFGWIEPK